jgi:hypothetical protein
MSILTDEQKQRLKWYQQDQLFRCEITGRKKGNCMHKLYTVDEIWDLIRGERVENRGSVPPYGNRTMGLDLEEYCIRCQSGDNLWIQVALDPAIGGEIVDWYVSEEEEDSWRVG